MKKVDKEIPKVCFFGIYDPLYSRNRVLIRGFQENGYEAVHCRVAPDAHRGISKFFFLVREYLAVRTERFDVVIVAFPGHTIVWLARILFGSRIIFDAFVSLYNSNVEDRKVYQASSLSGLWDRFLDQHSMKLASVVLFDTNAQIEYASKKFGIVREKFRRVFVGADDTVFKPREQRKDDTNFVVHFHGTFIPLHGVEYIIEAAKMLEVETDIVFEIIGNGQERKSIEQKMASMGAGKNIRLLPKIPYEELATTMSRADICLGIFGTTSKALMVIPNKVFEALASRKALITMRSPAIGELCVDKKHLFLCDPGDARDLAEKIRILKGDPAMLRQIADGGYTLFTKELTPLIVVRQLLNGL